MCEMTVSEFREVIDVEMIQEACHAPGENKTE